MKKGLGAVLTAAAVLAIPLMACYAFGVFDDKESEKTSGRKYTEFIYSGGLKNERFDGMGSLLFSNGERYTGTFADGRFSGGFTFNGIFVPADSLSEPYDWKLEGFFDDGSLSSGKFYYPENFVVAYTKGDESDTFASSGWLYEGDLEERGQSGTGLFVFADGNAYRGEFFRGMAEGDGTLSDSEGNVIYRGAFLDGRFSGKGTYYSPDGWYYEGDFREGTFHGEGSLTDGEKTSRGLWDHGVQVLRHE